MIAVAPVVADELLDEMFSHEAKCESTHTSPDNRDCSGGVTSLIAMSCGTRILVCSLAAHRVSRIIAAAKYFCEECGIPCADCWTVAPA